MRYYIYAIVVDEIYRYIGKGTRKRVGDHMRMVRRISRLRAAGETVRTSIFYNQLTKAWLNGSQISEVILIDTLDEALAYEKEIEGIAKYRNFFGYGQSIVKLLSKERGLQEQKNQSGPFLFRKKQKHVGLIQYSGKK